MPRIPGDPPRYRPIDREIPLHVKVLLIRLYRKVLHSKITRIRVAINGFLSGDPWQLLGFFGLRNWTPIRHEPKAGETLFKYTPGMEGTADLSRDNRVKPGEILPENQTFTVYGFHDHGPVRSRRKVIDVSEPLGPEEYELGKTVSPEDHIPDPELERMLRETDFGPEVHAPATSGVVDAPAKSAKTAVKKKKSTKKKKSAKK